MKRHYCALFAGLWVGAVPAGAIPAGAAEPSDPAAPVPAIQYQSPFDGYRPLGEDQQRPWRAANDTVGRIGGWRAYAKEAAGAADATKADGKTPPAPPAPATQPAPAPPATHKHGG